MPKKQAAEAGLYRVPDETLDKAYIEEIRKLVLHQEIIDEMADKLKIVYTPLHGTGRIPVKEVLKELGFEHVYVVAEQELPDGDFPTVSYPNPGGSRSIYLGLKAGQKGGCRPDPCHGS